MSTAPAPALRGADLRLGYQGREVVHGADLELVRGRITCLVGPNGSGKSTVLRSLARLHRADAGSVELGEGGAGGTVDALALSAPAFALRVTLMSQHRATPSGVRVRDVVGYGRHPHAGRFRRMDPDGPAVVAWAMEVTGVATMAERTVDELSGGEVQRVWLATCLAQRTDVLLLDEPTNHLDLRYQWELLDLVRDLARSEQVAVGMVLHDLDQAAAVADDVALLTEGEVVATGTPEEVFTTEQLSAAYGIRIDIAPCPFTGKLMTRPASSAPGALPAAPQRALVSA